MTRTRVRFSCAECGAQAPRWLGRCPECGGWDTLHEESVPGAGATGSSGGPTDRPVPLGEVDTGVAAMRPTGIEELDRVLGGGLVGGSVTLLGGEPGIGKSTLMLQALARMAAAGALVLLVTAEESKEQVRLRAERLGALHPNLMIVAETSLPHVLTHVAEVAPDVLAVDSIQTVADPGRPRCPGIGEPGAGVRAPAGPAGEGPQPADAARRARDEGRRDRRPPDARAHRGHGPRVRGRSPSRPAHAARAQAPVRLDPRARAVRHGGVGPGRRVGPVDAVSRRPPHRPPGVGGDRGARRRPAGAGRGAGAGHRDARADAAALVAGPRSEPVDPAARGARRPRRAPGRRMRTSTPASPAESG